MKTMEIIISSTTILQILNPEMRLNPSDPGDPQESPAPIVTIENAFFLDKGIPIVSTTLGEFYTFHGGIRSWIKIADRMHPLCPGIDINFDKLEAPNLSYSNIAPNTLGDIEACLSLSLLFSLCLLFHSNSYLIESVILPNNTKQERRFRK